MKYFKIKTGFRAEDSISITESELESALYAFITDSKGVFRNGAVSGKNIISITEDWHKAMGWNAGHVLGPDDYAEIREKLTGYTGMIAAAKDRVQGHMASGRLELIGKNVGIEAKLSVQRIEGMKSLSDSMRIK